MNPLVPADLLLGVRYFNTVIKVCRILPGAESEYRIASRELRTATASVFLRIGINLPTLWGSDNPQKSSRCRSSWRLIIVLAFVGVIPLFTVVSLNL